MSQCLNFPIFIDLIYQSYKSKEIKKTAFKRKLTWNILSKVAIIYNSNVTNQNEEIKLLDEFSTDKIYSGTSGVGKYGTAIDKESISFEEFIPIFDDLKASLNLDELQRALKIFLLYDYDLAIDDLETLIIEIEAKLVSVLAKLLISALKYGDNLAGLAGYFRIISQINDKQSSVSNNSSNTSDENNEKLKSEISRLNYLIDHREDTYNDLGAKNSFLKLENKELASKSYDLEVERAQLKKDLQELQKENLALTEESKKSSQMKKIEAENTRLIELIEENRLNNNKIIEENRLNNNKIIEEKTILENKLAKLSQLKDMPVYEKKDTTVDEEDKDEYISVGFYRKKIDNHLYDTSSKKKNIDEIIAIRDYRGQNKVNRKIKINMDDYTPNYRRTLQGVVAKDNLIEAINGKQYFFNEESLKDGNNVVFHPDISDTVAFEVRLDDESEFIGIISTDNQILCQDGQQYFYTNRGRYPIGAKIKFKINKIPRMATDIKLLD